MQIFQAVQEAAQSIRNTIKRTPQIGISAGTGLSDIESALTDVEVVEYHEIPHFALSTVESHQNKLIFGKIAGIEVVLLGGRFHYYEGYDMKQITFPIRVLKELGINTLLLSNVSGGLNPNFETGELMVITDHINLMVEHPLRGPNDDKLGLRFPDMLGAYDAKIQEVFHEMAKKATIQTSKGVYISWQGPSLETPAEYNFLRIIGADAVGMSTVPEVLVARHCGLRVGAISLISNMCFPIEKIKPATLESVLEIARERGPLLSNIFINTIEQYGKIW